jgi:hypothetical protein
MAPLELLLLLLLLLLRLGGIVGSCGMSNVVFFTARTNLCLVCVCQKGGVLRGHECEVGMALYMRWQRAAPKTTNFITGGVIMSAGDATVQLCVEGAERLNVKRNGVAASFNSLMSVPLGMWYARLDRVFPGLMMRQLVPKILVNQIFSTLSISPSFLLWSNSIEALLDGKSLAAARDVALERFQREVGDLVQKSFMLWMPVHLVTFNRPANYRIMWVSTVSVGWGAYCSFVAHRVPPAGHGQGAPSAQPAS